MGFFKDLKDDLSQAVNELLPDENLWGEEYDDNDFVNTLDNSEKKISSSKANRIELEEDNNILNVFKQQQMENEKSTIQVASKAEGNSEKDILDELEKIIAAGQQAKKEEQKNLVNQNNALKKSKAVERLKEEIELVNQQMEQEKVEASDSLKETTVGVDAPTDMKEVGRDEISFEKILEDEVSAEQMLLDGIELPNIDEMLEKQSNISSFDNEEKMEVEQPSEIDENQLNFVFEDEEQSDIMAVDNMEVSLEEKVHPLEEIEEIEAEKEPETLEQVNLEEEISQEEATNTIEEFKVEQEPELLEESLLEEEVDTTVGLELEEKVIVAKETNRKDEVTSQDEVGQIEEFQLEENINPIEELDSELVLDSIEEVTSEIELAPIENLVLEPEILDKESADNLSVFEDDVAIEMPEELIKEEDNNIAVEAPEITFDEQESYINTLNQDDDTIYNEKNVNNSNKEIAYKEEDAIMLENTTLEMGTTETEETKEGASATTKETMEAVQPSDETTVISKATRITGSISSDCSLEVLGTIEGNVECLGKLSVVGTVKGNCKGAEVYVNTERLNGNIESESSVKIGVGTVVIGDVNGTSAIIAGAVKGEVDISGPVVIDSTAIIKGNINAKSIQINNGAVIDGYCSLSYASIDIDNFFDAE